MAIILFNPTNEEFCTQYSGEEVIIAAGGKVKVDVPRGRHVLNTLGPRGLMTLEYGDEGDGEMKKAAIGRERNMAFKRKQVLDFNQINEGRFQSKLPYLKPTAQMNQYAKELGIGLREPYNVEDAAKKEMAVLLADKEKLQAEVKEKDRALDVLQQQVATLTDQFKQFLQLAGAKQEVKGGNGADEELDGIKVSYSKLNKRRFIVWVAKNWNLIQTYPEEIRKDIAAKHESLYGAPFPTEQPIVEEHDVV
jgi:hypothetical protein